MGRTGNAKTIPKLSTLALCIQTTCNWQLATGNLLLLSRFALLLEFFLLSWQANQARQSKARQVELREEKKSQGDTKQKLAKLNLWPLFFANCKCKMKCLATRQTRRDGTWRAGVRVVVWCGMEARRATATACYK